MAFSYMSLKTWPSIDSSHSLQFLTAQTEFPRCPFPESGWHGLGKGFPSFVATYLRFPTARKDCLLKNSRFQNWIQERQSQHFKLFQLPCLQSFTWNTANIRAIVLRDNNKHQSYCLHISYSPELIKVQSRTLNLKEKEVTVSLISLKLSLWIYQKLLLNVTAPITYQRERKVHLEF